MKKIALACAVLALVLAHHSDGPAAENSLTLTGSFTNQGKKYDIKGVFTPDGAGQWKTVWTFTFGRRGPQVFKGTAEGNLQKGTLKGVVNERRKFVFEGTWTGTKFTGKTAEYFKPDGKPSPTGTIELSRGK